MYCKLKMILNRLKLKTRSIQRTPTPPRLWPLTLTCDIDLTLRSRKLIIRCRLLYCAMVPGNDVCECNSFRDMTINSFFVTFDLQLWPLAYVKVTFKLISRCTLFSCTLVPSIKFVCSIEFEIWTILWKKKNFNEVTITSLVFRF